MSAVVKKLGVDTTDEEGEAGYREVVVKFASQSQFDQMEGQLFDDLIEPLNKFFEACGDDGEFVDDTIEVVSDATACTVDLDITRYNF